MSTQHNNPQFEPDVAYMPVLHWTTAKPTREGWYWFDGRVDCATDTRKLRVQVYEVKTNEFWGKGELALHETDHLIFGLHELIGKWSGPLQAPGEEV